MIIFIFGNGHDLHNNELSMHINRHVRGNPTEKEGFKRHLDLALPASTRGVSVFAPRDFTRQKPHQDCYRFVTGLLSRCYKTAGLFRSILDTCCSWQLGSVEFEIYANDPNQPANRRRNDCRSHPIEISKNSADRDCCSH